MRIGALLLVSFLAAELRLASAQLMPDTDPRQQRHEAALFSDAVQNLIASPELLDELSPPATPFAWPTLAELRSLVAAESFDVQVLPGAFQAHATPRVDVATVRVWPLRQVAVPSAVTLRARWVLPGGESLDARTTVVEPRALAAPGFDVFLTKPSGPPGAYGLEVDLSGAAGSVIALRVEAVRDLERRAGGLRERYLAGELPAELNALARDVLDLLDAGARAPHGLGVEQVLASCEGTGDALPIVGVGLAERVNQGFALAGVGEPLGTVVLLAPAAEAPDACLAGARGDAWRALAREHGLRIVSIRHVPGRTLLEELAEAGLTLDDADRTLLVARGDAGLGAGLALGTQPGLASFTWVLQRARPGQGLPVRGLQIVPPDTIDSDDPDVAAALPHPFATDLALPSILDAWFERGGFPLEPR